MVTLLQLCVVRAQLCTKINLITQGPKGQAGVCDLRVLQPLPLLHRQVQEQHWGQGLPPGEP